METWVIAITDEYSSTTIKRVQADHAGIEKYVRRTIKGMGANKGTLRLEKGRNGICASAYSGQYSDMYLSVTAVRQESMKIETAC